MNRRRLLAPILGALLLVACHSPVPKTPAPPPGPDAAAIRAALDARMAAVGPLFDARDAEGLAAFFTDDATWILPDATSFTGKDAILAGAKAFLATLDSIHTDSAVIDRLIVVSDSEALTFAHNVGVLRMKGAKRAERHLNPYADHWKRGTDGVWRVAYEVNAGGVLQPAK